MPSLLFMKAIKITNTAGNTMLVNLEHIVSIEDAGTITIIETVTGRIDVDIFYDEVVRLVGLGDALGIIA